MLVGKCDLIGKTRPRSRDRGYPLASSSTLNRLEPGDPEKAPTSQNKRIVGDRKALDRLFVDVFIESFDQAPKEIWLDLDATDDLLHGSQEQRFIMGITKIIAIWRCIYSVVNTSWTSNCARRTRMLPLAVRRN